MCNTWAIPVTHCLRSAQGRPHTSSSQQSSGPIARASVDQHFSGSFPHAIDRAMPPAAAQLSMRRGTGPLGLAPLDDC
jgi:hypothetical protein